MVSRFREERGAGHDVPDAVRRTMATAGRTVVFSAATVAVALIGLLVFDEPTIRSLGLAGIGVVLATAAGRPHPAAGPAPAGRRAARSRGPPAPTGTGSPGIARVIQRGAVPVVVVVGVGLALLSLPFTNARFEDIGVHALPESSETRQVAETVDRVVPRCGPSRSWRWPTRRPTTRAWPAGSTEVEGLDGVAGVEAQPTLAAAT